LFRLVNAPNPHLGAELRLKFQQEDSTAAKSNLDKQLRRVNELISKAESYAEKRKRRAAEKKAREEARKKKERARAREKYLKGLVGQEDRIWFKVNKLIDSKQPKKYDEAVALLVDLRNLNKKTGTEKAFNRKFKTICEHHHRKLSFLNRLKKAGLRG
jgi:hypothetical protein